MNLAVPAPRALRWTVAAALALVFAFLLVETQILRPGYGVGDETTQVRMLTAHMLGEALPLHWAQGSLHRLVLGAWTGLAGPGLGRLHVPGLAFFALELAALWAVARRWFGQEAALWAVLLDLVSATAWLRARSLLTYQVVPLELLLFALLAGRVRGPWGALALGLAASLLSLDYEAAMIAGPFVLAACALREPDLSKRLGWVLAGLLGGVGLIALSQTEVVSAYAGLRSAVNLGAGAAGVLASWGKNLGWLLMGGEPMPYLGVSAWPAWALWGWLPLGIGAIWAWSNGGRSLLLWAAAVVLITQASGSPYGVPAHRLSAAWPAFCLLGGMGLSRWRQALGNRQLWALPLLLLLGLATEASAYFRHMALHGRQVWGRSELMAQAARDLGAERERSGAAICTALMEVRYPDIRFHLASQPGLPGGSQAWVLLPPEFRQASAGLQGRPQVWSRSPNDEPIFAMGLQGAEARRFIAMEAGLRPLLDRAGRGLGQGSEADRAWLASRPAPDLWSWSAVLQRDLRRAWEGKGLERQQLDLLITRAPISPGPDATVGRFLIRHDPSSSLRFLERALAIDPGYSPALNDRAKALDALGRTAEAQAAREHWAESFRQGAWQIYD